MRTLRAEQIKKTKTILRVYMCDTEGVYRRLRHRKKMQASNLSTRIFCGASFYKRQEKKLQREKKDDPSPAIGENYIYKIFPFFNILFMDVFTYRLTIKNPKILATEKGDKKFQFIFLHLLFILLLRG